MSFLFGQADVLLHVLVFLCMGGGPFLYLEDTVIKDLQIYSEPHSSLKLYLMVSHLPFFRIILNLFSFLRILNTYFMVPITKGINDYYKPTSPVLLSE